MHVSRRARVKCEPADLRTCGWVNCRPKDADRKCGHVGKTRTLILRTLGFAAKKGMNETWLNVYYLVVYCLYSYGYILRSCLKTNPKVSEGKGRERREWERRGGRKEEVQGGREGPVKPRARNVANARAVETGNARG